MKRLNSQHSSFFDENVKITNIKKKACVQEEIEGEEELEAPKRDPLILNHEKMKKMDLELASIKETNVII